MYDLIIVGAGAAGLFLGANVDSKKALILESMNSPGKKLAITGSGMCNLTNCDEPTEFLNRFGGRKQMNFLKPAVRNFTTTMCRTWFEHRGLQLVIREDGKVFPSDLDAKSVIRTLEEHSCSIKFHSKVTSITRGDDCFTVSTDSQKYVSRFLVLTCGGKSYSATGSDGSGYALAASLGHRIIFPTPALTALRTPSCRLTELSGTSLVNIEIDFFHAHEAKRYLHASGDLLFTHDGLSGPVILNNSRYIQDGDRLVIRFAGREILHHALNSNAKKQISTTLKAAGLTAQISQLLLSELFIDPQTQTGQLTKKQRSSVLQTVCSYTVASVKNKGFKSAMVTSGGVSLDEVDRKTMESTLVPGLFFAGEILDIDGDTGGYNLQAAWSTSKLASDHLNKVLRLPR
jgi:predicted Rossmann fold flavoprotein